MKGSYIAAFLVLLACQLLVSCGERKGLAPVEEIKWMPFNEKATYHVVRPRDTLYSIAFRYEKEYHQLASINRLAPPYDIKPGQRIRLISSYAKQSKEIKTKKKYAKPPVYHIASKSNLLWQWPVSGNVINTFAPLSGRKGIDIGVEQQKTVKAASAGTVAYSGDGIPGYGHLIIVKHDNQFLTAYAHNAKNLVNEGEKVSKGQAIAYTGLIAANKRGVHFELRKNGKPVNPLNYLTNG